MAVHGPRHAIAIRSTHALVSATSAAAPFGTAFEVMASDLGAAVSHPAAGRPGSSRANARRALESCWPVLGKIIEARIALVLHDALTPMAKSDDRDEATPAKFVLAREREFCAAYGIESRAEFNRAIADFVAHKVEEKNRKKSALSLIGYDDMELSTVVERGAARIRNSADESFGRVKMRIANLVGEPDLRDSDNPLRPAVFLRPLHVALEKAQTPIERRLPYLLLLEEPFTRLMVLVYDALDAFMAEKGASDELPAGAWRPTHSGFRTGRNTVIGDPGRTTETGGAGAQSGSAGGTAATGSAATEQMLLSLYQRLQLFDATVRAGALEVAAAGYPVPAAVMQPARAGASLMSMFGASSPTGYGGAPVAPGAAGNFAPIVIDANLIGAINEIQKLSALALSVAQRGRRTRLSMSVTCVRGSPARRPAKSTS